MNASKELKKIADALEKHGRTYDTSIDFQADLDELISLIKKIETLITDPGWREYLKLTDTNFSTNLVSENSKFFGKFKDFQKALDSFLAEIDKAQ